MGDSISDASFGEWVRRRRQVLDLTQSTLAYRVGCAAITIRKIESDERRPSRQMAARLAESLAIAQEGHPRFIAVALGEQSVARLPVEASSDNDLAIQKPLNGVAETDEIRVVTVVAVGLSHPVETRWSLRPDKAAELRDRLHAVVQEVFAEDAIPTKLSLDGCLVAFFGAPTLHEDDPERALQAALQIKNAGQNAGLSLAIGIHSGPAYLHYLQEAHSLFGSTMKVALRLQGQADDGQILVSKKVYRQTRRAFEFLPFEAKFDGQAIPAAHLLLRSRPHMEKSRGIEGYLPKLVGRDQELAKLEQLVDGLASGEGQLVILSGEAGVGKSRLIAELKSTAFSDKTKQNPPLWLEGRCLERTINVGYGPFLDLLRSYFAWGAEEDEPGRAAQLQGALEELVNDGHLSASEVGKLGALLGNLFALHFGNEWNDYLRQSRPEQLRHQTFQAIYTLFVALAKRQPLILIFEDLHWADGVSLELITQLMEVIPATPLLLLCVCRPEQAHRSNQLATIASRKCLGNMAEITLRELPTRHSRQLLQLYLGDDLSDHIAQTILARAQGNPFFIEEMVHTLISLDLLYQEDNRWLARAALDGTIVPDTIQNLLLSRVERLSAAQKNLLYHAAVIGRHFSLQLLSLMTHTHSSLDDHLWQLEEEAFLYQERTMPQVIYTFRHILTHEAIYATIPRRRLQPLHSKVASAIERLYADDVTEQVESLAYHYERSENLQKAVDYLLKAAHKAQRAYLNEEAIGYFGRALTCLDELPADGFHKEQRLATLLDLGQTYYHGTSQLDRAEECFRQALALGETMELPPRRMAYILVWLGDILMNWQPRFDESLRLGHAALALLGDDNECNEAAWSLALISLSHLMVGAVDEANEYALHCATFADRLPCIDVLDHLVYMAISCALVHYRQADEARRWLEHSIHHAERNQHLHALAESTSCLAYIFEAGGNTRAGIATRQIALDDMSKAGDGKRRNWSQMATLWSYLHLGEMQALRELSLATLADAQLVNQEYLYDLYFCLGIADLVEGAWQEAESHFHQAIQCSEPNSSPWAESQIALGHLFLIQGKRNAAISLFKMVASSALPLPDFAWRDTRGVREVNTPLISALTALDAALPDGSAMSNFCTALQAEATHSSSSRFMQWYLERAEIDPAFSNVMAALAIAEREVTATEWANAGWQWQDWVGDCSFTYESAITVHAALERSLWHLNESAPRLYWSIEGDFALQTKCEAFSSEKPALGGIVLWHNLINFVLLDWGSHGVGEVTLMGCVANQNVIVGRGRIRADKAYLRLERSGDRVRALCSENGDEWYTVGQVEFASSEALEIGLYANGTIDRLLYRGRYPDGSAIRFSDIQLRARETVVIAQHDTSQAHA